MTARVSKYHHGIKDFSFAKDKEERIKIHAVYQRQEPDPYTLAKDKSSFYCCEYCGSGPCICKYSVEYDSSTGLFIVKGDL